MPPPVRDGDWTCTESDCKASNFARRTECFKCGKGRDFKAWKKQKAKEIGGSEAKKSGGLFSADDWRCNKCGNINWARRNTCNMCNAPKVEDDERTGFGGGFNDRQDVEYIDRDSSGDEIDDFGRKKKKFRSHLSNDDDKPRKEVLKPGFDGQTREADDDDDDDEDDEDASKYNLDDDSDEESESKKENPKKSVPEKNNREKRASSSSSSSSASSAKSRSSSSSDSNTKRSRSRSRHRKKSSSRSQSRSRRSTSKDKKKSRKRSRSSRRRSRSRSSSPRRSSSREKSKSSSKYSSNRNKKRSR